MYYEEDDGNFCYCGFFMIALFEDHDDWRKLLESNSIKFKFDEEIGPSMKEVGQWCDDNLKEGWLVGVSTSGFYNTEDATVFKLRWA